jgi:hypothetical protein
MQATAAKIALQLKRDLGLRVKRVRWHDDNSLTILLRWQDAVRAGKDKEKLRRDVDQYAQRFAIRWGVHYPDPGNGFIPLLAAVRVKYQRRPANAPDPAPTTLSVEPYSKEYCEREVDRLTRLAPLSAQEMAAVEANLDSIRQILVESAAVPASRRDELINSLRTREILSVYRLRGLWADEN